MQFFQREDFFLLAFMLVPLLRQSDAWTTRCGPINYDRANFSRRISRDEILSFVEAEKTLARERERSRWNELAAMLIYHTVRA